MLDKRIVVGQVPLTRNDAAGTMTVHPIPSRARSPEAATVAEQDPTPTADNFSQDLEVKQKQSEPS